jgi:PST family polysaccharide transporter
VAAEVLALASTVILARLIPPAEFGRAVVALIVVAFAAVLTPQGFGSALVRMPTVERAHLESAVLLSLVAGGLFELATLLLAPVVAAPIFGDRIAELIQLTAPVWLFAAFGTVPLALLQRKMDFRRLGLIEVASLVAASATALSCAFAGLDSGALVAGGIAGAGMSSFLYLAAGPRMLPRWHKGAAQEIARFGIPSTLSSLAYAGFRNIDYAILGARLNPAQLGYYSRAYQIGVDYQGKITRVMMQVAFSAYSRTTDLADMRELRQRIARMHATLIFPLLGLVIATAPILLPSLLGDGWKPAVTPTRILAMVGMTTALAAGTGPLLVAAGKPGVLLTLNVVTLAVYAVVVFLAAPFGLTTVCVAVVFHSLFWLAALYVVMERVIDLPIGRVVGEALPGSISTAALIAAVWPATGAMHSAGVSPILILALDGLTAAGVYLGVLRFFFPSAWEELALITRRVLWVRRRRPVSMPKSETAALVD